MPLTLKKENEIQFTQYVFPHGKKRPIYIERSFDICQKAKELEAGGYVFEAELNGDLVTFYCTKSEQSIIRIARNGVEVDQAVNNLVLSAYEIMKVEQRAAHEDNAL